MFTSSQQFAGLSQADMSHWQSALGQNRVEGILIFLILLIYLAEQCQSLLGRSNEAFMTV